MDIEKINSVLNKAIVAIQEDEIDEAWAVGSTDYDVPKPTKKGVPSKRRGGRKKTDPLGEDGLSELVMVCKKGIYSTKVHGMTVDSATACLVVDIAKKLNPQNRKKFLALPAKTALRMAWDLASKSGGVSFKSA